MIRLISIEKADILSDPEDAGKVIAHALRRKVPMKYAGFCDLSRDTAAVVLEEVKKAAPEQEFIFSPLDSNDIDDVAAVARRRFESGYSTLAVFRIQDAVWGLFCRKKG